jgi:ribosomal protein L11 methyltransferase
MRRILMRVRAGDLAVAYDRLLPELRGGLHSWEEGEEVVLVALGEEGELPALDTLSAIAGELLLAPATEEDAGSDLGAALAALLPRWEVGGRVVLRTADQAPAPDGWIDVVLARGAGFGTGNHPTTRHCLELLLGLEPHGSFADLGCGAGALTIAAAKLGYAPVVGVDLDPDVTATALRNATANGVDADFVTGNLLAVAQLDVEVAVVNVSELDVHEHLAAAGFTALEALVVSGLDDPAKLAAALGHYAAAGLRETRRIDRRGWPAVLLAPTPAPGHRQHW